MARYERVFQPISSSSPAFNTTSGSSSIYAIESTAIGRQFKGPTGRTVRLASISGDDFYLHLGSSSMTLGSSIGILVLGGTVESFALQPYQTHIGVFSSTDVIINICGGYGF